MRLFAFDLDGTLVDSAPDIALAVNRMLAKRGIAPLPVAIIAPMLGDGLHPLIDRVFAAAGALQDEAAALEYLHDYEDNVSANTVLFPGIPELLDRLAADGWRLAVCTNKPAKAARLLLADLGIDGKFDAICGGDTFATRKPDPAHLRQTIELAGGTPERTLMIGDHRNDVATALGCGSNVFFAGWGYGRPGMEAGTLATVAHPGEVPALADRFLPA
jgi:phosphoglycolate phosphatase